MVLRSAAVAVLALLAPLMVVAQAAVLPSALLPSATAAGGSGGPVTSADGRITATKTASTYALGLGGGTVTYTYTVKNNSAAREYYVSGSDNKCGTPSSSGLSTERFNPYSYIPAGATVRFTCTQTVTVTTTNTATFTFNTRCGLFGCSGTASTVSPQATVDVEVPTYDCDTIWYGSLTSANNASPGSLGTLSPASIQVRDLTTPGLVTTFQNTSAMAINPLEPNFIYYTPRTTASTFSNTLYRYDTVTDTESQVATGLPAFVTNRLAFDSAGTLWSLANDGRVYSWTAAGGVSAGKIVTASNGIAFAALQSGDIAFDGLGNMWVLAADATTTYLYTISAASLATATPQAQLVGTMNPPTGAGALFYNGIAFDTSGTLYASANSGTSNSGNTWYLYTINKDTGAATQTATGTGRGTVADLASCALPKPQLTASKTVSPSVPAKVGDTLTYTIKVQNLGNLSATGTTFQDSIPAGTTYVAGSTTLNGTAVADSGGMPYTTTREIHGSTTSRAGVLPAGDTATISFKVTINSSAGDTVSNQGSVNFVGGTPLLTDDPSKPGGTDPTVTTVLKPAIEVAKTASSTTLNGSEPVTYTYSVSTGTGNEPLKNVVLSDDKCAVPSTHTGDSNSDGNLDPGETWVYTCTQTISTTTTNTATATGAGISTNMAVTDSAQATVTVTHPNLNVTKSAGPVTGPDANGNYAANYTIQVVNSGAGAASYGPLTDTPSYASNLAVTGASWSGQATGSGTGAGPFSIGTANTAIASGATHTYNLVVTFHYTNTSRAAACAGPGTGLFNSVTLPAGQEQGTTTDNSVCIAPPTPPSLGLSLVKSAALSADGNGDGLAGVGDQITFSFLVTNTGEVTVSGVSVDDELVAPAGPGVSVSCPVTSLAPGEQVTCTSSAYTVTQADVDAGGVANTATVSGTTPGGSTVTSPGSGTTTPAPSASGLSLVKSAALSADGNGDGLAGVGDQITFWFLVTNTGEVTVSGVSVDDELVAPAGPGVSVSCPVTSLAPGEQVTCTSSAYTVTQADVDAGGVVNTATVSGTTPGGSTVTSPGSGTTTPAPSASGLSLVKSAALSADGNGDGLAGVGDQITFWFLVTNTGEVTVSGVSVDDELVAPAGPGVSVSCPVTSLAPGEQVTCTSSAYTVTQADVDAGGVANTATVSGTTRVGPR